MRSHNASAALALLTAATVCGPAAGASHVFEKPMEGRYRLDWCLEWARQCGKPAANAWCRRKGYRSASRFRMDADIGARSPTRVLTTGAICAEASCDGFAYIVCTGPRSSGRSPPREAPVGDAAREAKGLLQRGFDQLKQRKPEQALRAFQRAHALESRIGNRRGEARSLAAVGGAYEAMARAEPTGFPGPSKPVYDRPELVERAVASLRKAAALFEKARDDADTWRTLFNIGVIYENSGDHNRAVAYYRRALAASDAAGERAKAQGRIACDTHDGSRLRGEFRGRDIQCFKAAFGSVSLVFDEDEWWNE